MAFERQNNYNSNMFGNTTTGAANFGGMEHSGMEMGRGAAGSTKSDKLIAVESTAEWQVHDITYDGQEHYLQPLVFSDHVEKLAHKINWRELIGDLTTRDDPSLVENDETSVNNDDKTAVAVPDSDKEKAASTSKADKESVGPWTGVAKKLHASLTEMNVLLDVVKVCEGRQYLRLDPTFAYQKEVRERLQRDQSTGSVDTTDLDWKSQTVAEKRMALLKASGVLSDLTDRLKAKAPPLGFGNSDGFSEATWADGTSSLETSDKYLEELRDMRERWRLKKVRHTILGDLGYRSYGTKFRPNATFEVSRKAETAQDNSCLEVTLPKDLERDLKLVVTVEKDGLLYACPQPKSDKYPAVIKYKWQETLYKAQQNLLVRDMFMQLAREAVDLEGRVSLVREDALTISLGMGYLLCIRMMQTDQRQSSFTNEPGSSLAVRLETIERNMRRMFCEELASEEAEFNRTVSMPLVPGRRNEQLLEGPHAKRNEQSRGKCTLLERVIFQTNHFLLVRRVQTVLREFSKMCQEPQLTWHWVETGPCWSVIRGQILTAYYEGCGKSVFMLEIVGERLFLITKDGDRTELSENPDGIVNTLWIQCGQHQLSGLCTLLRWRGWFVTHSNPCATDVRGNIAPTLLASNSSGNKSVCIRLPVRQQPEILMQKKLVQDFGSDLVLSDQWKRLRGEFEHYKLSDFEGFCFFHKVELMIAALS